MNDKANKAEALKLCNEYVDKGTKMMNDAILCISALENKDDIQECIAKVVSCFNVSIEFVVAAVNSHRNGGHACGECKRFGNKAVLKCVYRGANHPACDDFEQREPNISAEMIRDAENVPVVTEKAEQKQDKEKHCSVCKFFKKYDSVTDSGIAGRCIESDTNVYEEEVNVCFCEEFKPAHDAVHPDHYHKGGLECFDVIKAITGDKYEGFLVGNIIKYIFRYRDKNGLEDCKKAAVYLNKLIKELENEK